MQQVCKNVGHEFQPLGSLMVKTRTSGNRFILTVIEFTSHYFLAYPLKSQTAVGVVKCLVGGFSQYGFIDVLVSDCVTDILSKITQAFLVECHVGELQN